jgi:hypothetical protein
MRLDEIQASAAQEQRATTLKANADSQKIKASQAKLQADVASGQLKTQKAKQKNADAKSLRPIKPIVPSAGWAERGLRYAALTRAVAEIAKFSGRCFLEESNLMDGDLQSCVVMYYVATQLRWWCPRPESNRYTSRYQILSLARLPIPPPGQVIELALNYTHCSLNKFFANLCKQNFNATL